MRSWRIPRFLLRGQRECDAIRPAKAVLRRVFAPAGAPCEIDDVILLGHAASCFVRTAIERQPSRARRVGEIRAAVAADALDRHPLERRPSVRCIPLLATANECGHEATGLEKETLELRGNESSLLWRGQAEKQGCGRRECRTIRHA